MEKTKKITELAVLFAAAIALSWLESLIPLPSGLVGIKLGLSNIATMYCLFFLGKGQAFTLAALKAFFAFLTRGVTAGLMSLCGGLTSVIAMALVIFLFKDKISLIMISVIGGILHNIAQLFVACLLTQNLYSMYYLPVLLVAGTIAGVITGIVLKTVLPALNRIKS